MRLTDKQTAEVSLEDATYRVVLLAFICILAGLVLGFMLGYTVCELHNINVILDTKDTIPKTDIHVKHNKNVTHITNTLQIKHL